MFTVIVLSDRARARYERWRVLFEPFEEAGTLAVCDWQRAVSEDNLARVVPGLTDAVVGKREWRAVVVDTVVDDPSGAEATDPANPFDYLDNMGVDPVSGRPKEQLNLARSPHAVIRLAHMLLGYPDMGAKAFLPDPSYRDPVTGQRVHESEVRARAEAMGEDVGQVVAQFRAELVGKWDVQVHYREEQYTEEERDTHRRLADTYRPLLTRPNEVTFIATRNPVEGNPVALLRRAWGEFTDQGPSRFVERNDYPASCRFAVYDLPPANDVRFELDELRFWLSVLSIAANDLPASALQAERLYRVGVELDDQSLGRMLTEHLSRLAAARDDIDAEIRKPREGTEISMAELLRPSTVPVPFDQIGGEELRVPVGGYSWATDVPRSEAVRWNDAAVELRSKADAFVRRPRRVLSRTVQDTRKQTRAYLDGDVALDEIARDELLEELARRSHRLAQPATVDILNRARLKRIVDGGDAGIRRAISRRMTRNTIVFASAVVLLSWLAGFTPYLLQAGFIDWVTFADSVGVTLIGMLLLVLAGVVTLTVMRRRLVGRMRDLNRELRTFTTGVNAGAGEFGTYLSDVLTYMRGQAVLIATDRRAAAHEADRARWAAVRDRIQGAMDVEKAIVRGLDFPMAIERGAQHDLEITAGHVSHLEQLFHLPRGRARAMLNTSGETIEAPYAFVTRLTLLHLQVSEPTPIDAPVTTPSDGSLDA